jgi:hypothetical protein
MKPFNITKLSHVLPLSNISNKSILYEIIEMSPLLPKCIISSFQFSVFYQNLQPVPDSTDIILQSNKHCKIPLPLSANFPSFTSFILSSILLPVFKSTPTS